MNNKFNHNPPGATETGQLSNKSTLEYIKITRVYAGGKGVDVFFKGFLRNLDVNTKVKLSDIDPGYDALGAAKVRQGNTKSAAISFSVVAADKEEAKENFQKINQLFGFVNPGREGKVPIDTPTFKVSYMNILKDFYGYIEGFSFTPDLEQGAFIEREGEMYPKVCTINLDIEKADQGDHRGSNVLEVSTVRVEAGRSDDQLDKSMSKLDPPAGDLLDQTLGRLYAVKDTDINAENIKPRNDPADRAINRGARGSVLNNKSDSP